MDVKVFGREAMLMMVYANGDGVKRSFDVAIKMACELDNASLGETQGRVERLKKYKTENWKGNDFDLCQDSMSGFLQGQCAIHEEKSAAVDRKRKLDSLVAHWSEAERTALASLRVAAEEFFKARASNEMDLSGTGRTAFYQSEMTSLEDGFVEKLEKAEQGRLPRASTSEFAKADTELNAVYADLKRTWEDEVVGSVTVAGIKQTERAWIRYRDAWVTFAGIKYPTTNPETWKTLLTRERIKMLREFTI
jgi:uncharacterized protein YecT (DUF1311 family)